MGSRMRDGQGDKNGQDMRECFNVEDRGLDVVASGVRSKGD